MPTVGKSPIGRVGLAGAGAVHVPRRGGKTGITDGATEQRDTEEREQVTVEDKLGNASQDSAIKDDPRLNGHSEIGGMVEPVTSEKASADDASDGRAAKTDNEEKNQGSMGDDAGLEIPAKDAAAENGHVREISAESLEEIPDEA